MNLIAIAEATEKLALTPASLPLPTVLPSREPNRPMAVRTPTVVNLPARSEGRVFRPPAGSNGQVNAKKVSDRSICATN